MAYNPVGVDETNKFPPAVVSTAADLVLKAGSATQIRTAIDAAAATHTHPTTAVDGLTEFIQDTVAGLLKAGTNVTTAYDDAANTFTINATAGGGGTTDPEVVRDTIGGALVAGSGISVTINDAADTITIAVAGVPQSAVSGLSTSLATLQSNIDLKYTKPANGIPAGDMTSTVAISLGKADSAVQSAALVARVIGQRNGAATATKIDILTEAQYQALVTAGTVDANTIYHRTA